MSKNNSSGGGIGCSSVILIVFVILKLVGVINWDWVWVLSPFWISCSLYVTLFFVVFLFKLYKS